MIKKDYFFTVVWVLLTSISYSQSLITEKDYWDEAKTKLRQVYTYSKQEIGTVGGIITRDTDTKRITNIDASNYTFSQRIKQGKYTSYHENGKISRVGEYNNNVPIGIHKTYFSNGKPQAEITFIANATEYKGYIGKGVQIVDGTSNKLGYPLGITKIFDEEARLIMEVNFQTKTEKMPYVKTYYPNGKIKEEGEVSVTGTLHYDLKLEVDMVNYTFNFWKSYFESGALRSEQKLQGGKEFLKEFYQSGKLKKDSSLNDVKEVINGIEYDRYDVSSFTYYENGNKNSELSGRMNNAKKSFTGAYKEYFSNGQLKVQQAFNKGLPKGEALEYYENGKNKLKASYDEEGKMLSWEEFYENGNPKLKKLYKKNSNLGSSNYGKVYLTSFNEYHENGKVKSDFDLATNYSKNYNESGNLISEGQYASSEMTSKEGKWIYYDGNSNVLKAEYYEGGKLTKIETKEDFEKARREEEAKNAKQNFEKNSILIKEKYSKFESLYKSTSSLGNVYNTNVPISNVKKKPLYNAGVDLYNQYNQKISSSTDMLEKKKYSDSLLTLLDKLISLESKETSDLEKALKKTKDINESEKLILAY